jgi:hypothetical protein
VYDVGKGIPFYEAAQVGGNFCRIVRHYVRKYADRAPVLA